MYAYMHALYHETREKMDRALYFGMEGVLFKIKNVLQIWRSLISQLLTSIMNIYCSTILKAPSMLIPSSLHRVLHRLQ